MVVNKMVVNKIGKMKVEGLGGFRHVDNIILKSSKKSS